MQKEEWALNHPNTGPLPFDISSGHLTSGDTLPLPSPPLSQGPCTPCPSARPSVPVSFPIPLSRSLRSSGASTCHALNMNQNNYSSSTPTPAMLATFQHQKSTIFGPQSNGPPQLINGIGGGSINPAALTAASPSSSSPFPQQQQQQHINAMLQVVGITREQFQNMSNQERQSVGAKYMSIMNAHQHQQHQQQQQQQQMAMMNAMNNNNNAFSNQQQNFYDRPSSSASSHSQQPSSSQQQPSAMMPPPPPRPPTAQGGHHSRPGTSHAHRSPTIPGGPQGQMLEMMQMKEMMQQGQQRSQSRMVCFYIIIDLN